MSSLSKRKLQEEWAYNKYWVMAKSPTLYSTIRLLFKNNELNDSQVNQFYDYLKEVEDLPITPKYLFVAYQHMWGYFKKIATTDEKNHYLFLLEHIEDDPLALLQFLQELAKKYEISYLLKTKIIKKGL